MKFRILLPNFKLVIAVAGISASAWAYVVKEGDTLSTIAHTNISKNVYGKNGSLSKIIALNPQIKNPNLIIPGEEISIGESVVPVLAKHENATRSIAVEAAPVVEAEKTPEKVRIEMATDKNTFFKRGANLALTPYLSILSLDAKDRTTGNSSTVASKYDAGVTLSYVQDWSEKFHSQLNVKMGMVDFEKPTSSSRSLVDTQKFLLGFGVETSHELNEKLNLKLGVEYGKELFIRSASTQSETVDAVNIPTLGAKLSYDLANLDPFDFGISGTYKALLPANADGYDAKLGNLYGLSFYLNQRKKASESKFLTELGFYQRRQDTSFSTQAETNIIVSLKYFFSVGAREGEKR